jgi:hypothetical protein
MFGDLVPTATAAPTALSGMDRINANRAARGLPPLGGSGATAPGTPAPAAGGAVNAPTGPAPSNSALGAFQTFYNSPTYQFPLQQGLKAVNTGYAAKGALESGAAMKAIEQYGANSAAGALGTYMDQLYRQEALGEGASSSLAGVGQTMVGQVSANNNAAGDAAANAALISGQSRANNFNNIGGAIGTAAGAIGGAFGSSYSNSNALNNYVMQGVAF